MGIEGDAEIETFAAPAADRVAMSAFPVDKFAVPL